MRKIFKYRLEVGENHVQVQGTGFKAIAFQDQNGQLCVWAEVSQSVYRAAIIVITVVGTGFEVPANSKHIGTCQQGPFVWHAYQLEH